MTPYRKFELRMKLCEVVPKAKPIDQNLPIYEQEAAAEEHAIEEMAVQICDADASFTFDQLELLKLNSGNRQNRDQFVRARIAALTKGFEEALLREFNKYLDASAAVARGEGEIRSPKFGIDWTDDPFAYRNSIDPRPNGVTESEYERYINENIRKLIGLDGTQFSPQFSSAFGAVRDGDYAFGAPPFPGFGTVRGGIDPAAFGAPNAGERPTLPPDFRNIDYTKIDPGTVQFNRYGKGMPKPLGHQFATPEAYNEAFDEWLKNNE